MSEIRKPPLRPRRLRAPTSRRAFLAGGVGLCAAGGALAALGAATSSESAWGIEHDSPPVRPPTAHADDTRFIAACVRCGLCGTVCENGCIRFFGLDAQGHGALTPYLDVRRRSCTLCMRCTNICPTDALSAVPENLLAASEQVAMGVAVVDRDRCLSFLGRICGYCHDACPLPRKAIRLRPPARPEVLLDESPEIARAVIRLLLGYVRSKS